MISINKKILEGMILQAQTEYPNECCGVLLGKRVGQRKNVVKQMSVCNLADEFQKSVHFSISPLELWHMEQLAREEDLEIVGFYHSHPDHEPVASAEDVKYMIPGYSYPIISIEQGALTAIKSYEKAEFEQSTVEVEEIISEK